MNEHVTEWLGMYLDGELHAPRLRQVEDHLAVCSACRLELDKLQSLSQLLAETASSESYTPTERFISNLALRISAGAANLAGHAERATLRTASDVAWWLIPAGVLVAWIFVQIYLTASTMMATAVAAGWFGNMSTWLPGGSQNSAWFTTTMRLFGSDLPGQARTILGALDEVSIFGSQFTGQLVLEGCIGLVYWAWLVAWWRRRQQTTVESEVINLSSRS
jgi:hypothetical protein